MDKSHTVFTNIGGKNQRLHISFASGPDAYSQYILIKDKFYSAINLGSIL
jgi:hypothetical protein